MEEWECPFTPSYFPPGSLMCYAAGEGAPVESVEFYCTPCPMYKSYASMNEAVEEMTEEKKE